MCEISKGYALCDPPFEQSVDPCAAQRGQTFGIGGGAQRMLEACGKEHDFRCLVARIVGAVPEMHSRRLQPACDALDGGPGRFRRNCGAARAPAGFSGCVG